MALAKLFVSPLNRTCCRLFSKKSAKDALRNSNEEMIVSGKRLVKVLRWFVDSEKTFTDYTWADVRTRFGVIEPKTGDILPEIHDVSQKYVDDVLGRWKLCKEAIKKFPGRNEAECKLYITAMLCTLRLLPRMDQGWFEMEYRIKDTVISGVLNYAYVPSTGLLRPIVSIIEATDGKIVQGRAQNYVQLLSCYDLAQKSYLKLMAAKHRGVSEKQLLKDFSLCTYGVVSSVSEWLFVRFDGKEWLETNVIPVSPNFEADRENIKKILTILYSIFMHQNVCAHKLGNALTNHK